MTEFASRLYLGQGIPNQSILSFDGMKMCGQPLVKDRYDNIWIEDRCDNAVLGMISYLLFVPPPDASRDEHVKQRIQRADAVIRHWKNFCWVFPIPFRGKGYVLF